MRWATLVLLPLVTASACSDLRDFRGEWHGPQVGTETPALHKGIPESDATLVVDRVDGHTLSARLTIAGFLPETTITSLEGAEADVLSGITFGGAPLRVYLAFAPVPDGGGEALVVVSLYDDRRIEVRLLRDGTSPLYGIFVLSGSS
ncbi:MAG TPA: hypothetical protein VFT22_44530 [Kofleriaceae bacterium]|nr:hypothetical protein [Kofleriaceae bacterium]